jgi:hypothetical protein
MSPDVGLQVLAPAKDRLTRTPDAHRPDTGLVALLAGTGLSTSAYSTALRRIARPQGAVNRRVQRVVADLGTPRLPRTTFILRNLQPAIFVTRTRSVPTAGPVTIEAVAFSLSPPRSDLTWAEATADAVENAPPRPGFTLVPLVWPRAPHVPPHLPPHLPPSQPTTPSIERGAGLGPAPADARPREPGDPQPHLPTDPLPPPLPPVPPRPPPPLPPVPVPPRDSTAARAFRRAATTHLNRFFPTPSPRSGTLGIPTGLEVVFEEALLLSQPRRTYADRIRLLVDLKGVDRTDEVVLDRIGLAPVFDQPMARSLADLGQDLLLPGLDAVPPNTVVPLATNTPFVEAYLVGLNAELGRELLWREFPAPPRATYFRRFWDTAIAPGSPPDIDDLDEWGDRALGGSEADNERFVMLLRSELLRRYPHAVIYATRPGSEPPDDDYPVFAGAMEPDVRFFGFELDAEEMRERSLVIQEQPSAPRFGIEVDDDPGEVSHLEVTDQHSARVARRLRQLPVRITIPAGILLDEDEEE